MKSVPGQFSHILEEKFILFFNCTLECDKSHNCVMRAMGTRETLPEQHLLVGILNEFEMLNNSILSTSNINSLITNISNISWQRINFICINCSKKFPYR